jgi:hypothetical protein
MLRSSLPCFKVSPSISRPVLVWRRGRHYDVMDSANVPPDFEKLNSIEAKVSRAGKTQRMILRVFADRTRSLPKLAISTPVAVRRGSITHRGRKFRIRAPQNINDCGYTRLLERLVDGDPSIDELFGDFPVRHKIVKVEGAIPETHQGAILYMPSVGKITGKGAADSRQTLAKEVNGD